jgi:endoglucanase
VLPAALLSIILLVLWGFSTLRSRAPAALPSATHPSAVHKPSPTPDRRACSIGYRVTLDLGAYFTAQLTIQNTGKVPIDGWTLEFDFRQDQQITTGLEGSWDQSDAHVKVHDLIYNRSVAQGKTITIHFIGSHHSTKNEVPRRFTVNGVRCQQAAQG